MSWPTPRSGEWVAPIRRGYKMCCCDCRLVHKLNFRLMRGQIQFQVFRDNRSTAASRRSKTMPWTPKDASRHTKKAKSPTSKRQWSHVADAVLAKTGNEGRAIREANAVVRRRKKR